MASSCLAMESTAFSQSYADTNAARRSQRQYPRRGDIIPRAIEYTSPMNASDLTTITNSSSATIARRPAARRERFRPHSLYEHTLDELADWLAARGQPRYRARQLFDWAYRNLADDYTA